MPEVSEVPIYDSAQEASPAIQALRELVQYQNLLVQFVRRDLLTRYKRSVLGIAWTMLNPLGTMLVLTLAFSQAFGTTERYAPFVLSGLLAWTFFAQTTNAITVNQVWGSALLKKIYVPHTIFAISAVGTGMVNLLFSLVPLAIVLLVAQVPIRWTVLLLPVPMLFLAMFALGLGLIIATMAVYFADVAEMYQILLTAWMYLSPVIYPEEYLPEAVRVWIIWLNPMYHLLKLFRAPVYDGRVPTLEELGIGAAIASITLLVGWVVFTRRADEFAYRT